VINACIEVHRNLGPGFEEVIYQRSLYKEFDLRRFEFAREVWINVEYKGMNVGRKRVDFVVEELLLEIKAKSAIEDVDYIQTLSYLKASGFKVGLLINFGAKTLEIKRLVNNYEDK
jgi:GxxExxY protein